MSTVPKRVIERYRKEVPRLQKVLKTASDRDLNEADTVSIVKGILSDVFGFDKYLDITSEYAIRGTYCDLAIKMDDKIQYLIEVKAVGITLKENHMRQTVNYGANHGVQWVVLTNGLIWNVYKINLEKRVESELVFTVNFLDVNPRCKEDQDMLFLLSKRGVAKSAREEYYTRVQSLNRFIVSSLVMSEPFITNLRKDIRKLTNGMKVENSEIESILQNEVLKRDVIEGDEVAKARNRINKMLRKGTRKVRRRKAPSPVAASNGNGDG